MSTHVSTTAPTGRDVRYVPKPGAVCAECGKPATIHCPPCGKDFCDECEAWGH
jgi:B-box zinc finger